MRVGIVMFPWYQSHISRQLWTSQYLPGFRGPRARWRSWLSFLWFQSKDDWDLESILTRDLYQKSILTKLFFSWIWKCEHITHSISGSLMEQTSSRWITVGHFISVCSSLLCAVVICACITKPPFHLSNFRYPGTAHEKKMDPIGSKLL